MKSPPNPATFRSAGGRLTSPGESRNNRGNHGPHTHRCQPIPPSRPLGVAGAHSPSSWCSRPDLLGRASAALRDGLPPQC